MKVSKLVLATAALVAAPLPLAQPVGAQQGNKQQAKQEGPRLSREETAAIRPLSEAVRAAQAAAPSSGPPNPQAWAAALAALPAAQAAAQQPTARFEVGRLQLQIAQGTQNREMQQQAVDAMLASNGAPASALPTLLGARASLAIQASDWATADTMLTRYLELDASNVERLRQAAEVKIALQRNGDALAIYQRLLAAQDAANQTPTQEVINRTIALAADQRNAQLVDQLTQRLLRAYPNTDSWRTALIRLRQSAGQDAALGLDVRRLMRTAGVFARAGDYVEFVTRLNTAGQPAEAKAVLEDGIARGTLSASDPEVRQMLAAATARAAEDRAALPALRTRAMAAPTGREARIAGDTFYANGDYAAAAELYRAALQKGGEDASLVNTRLGASLAAARQTAEAQAAFRAVTGPRQPLAAYWLMWLERPATAAAPARPAQ